MALTGTALLCELGDPLQDGNLPRTSWIHGAPSLSPPAHSRWCNTNWVQVSRAVLTQGTDFQNTSLGLFLFLEHCEGQDTCTQPDACTAQTHTASTLTCTYMHTWNSLCAPGLSAPTVCTHVCKHAVHCPNVLTACAHTHICTHKCMQCCTCTLPCTLLCMLLLAAPTSTARWAAPATLAAFQH